MCEAITVIIRLEVYRNSPLINFQLSTASGEVISGLFSSHFAIAVVICLLLRSCSLGKNFIKVVKIAYYTSVVTTFGFVYMNLLWYYLPVCSLLFSCKYRVVCSVLGVNTSAFNHLYSPKENSGFTATTFSKWRYFSQNRKSISLTEL